MRYKIFGREMKHFYIKKYKKILIKNILKQNFYILCFFFIIFTSCSIRQKYKNLSIQKIEMTLNAIKNLYVDTINDHKLIEDAIVALLQKLDPHSEYMTLEEANDMNESLKGNFEGIGIQFSIISDTLYVIHVITGGPSEKIGIRSGDRIIKINDTVITGKSIKNTDIINLLRGQKGTTVNIQIIRDHHLYPKTFKIIRDQIPIQSLDAFYMLDKETGYIKLSRFSAETYEEFNKAIKKLKKKGLKNLILDLQDNGGGYLQSAVDIANEFFKKNVLIVYTEGAHQIREEAYTSVEGSFIKGRIIVLINEYTASASEIVAGALQDWDRAIIVGRRSFGKGLVQRPIQLIDGSILKLTTARYYTPTGRSIQKPYEKGNKELYEKDLIDRYNKGEMTIIDSIHFPDSLKYCTLINKRTVYGGGGIMPDYFVPIDMSQCTNIHSTLITSDLINKFVITYVDKHRLFLQKKYSKIDIYIKHFNVSRSMMKELLNLLKVENTKIYNSKISYSFNNSTNKKFRRNRERTSTFLTEKDIKQFKKSLPLIKLQIKALIANNIWDTNKYYQIINEEKDIMKKAAKIIKNSDEYSKLLGTQ